MTDTLYQRELEDYRDYRVTFVGNSHGQRVLSDLVEKFCYNTIELPASEMDMAKLDGSRDVIRYIIHKMGLGRAHDFVKGLAMVIPDSPESREMEAITE